MYTSPYLTHLCGSKNPKDHETKFETLVSILRSQELRSWELQHYVAVTGRSSAMWIGNRGYSIPGIGLPKDINELNNKFRGEFVCLADIPLEELSIHAEKYGYFGLSFSKDFAIEQGASPVFYVCADAVNHEGDKLQDIFCEGMQLFSKWQKDFMFQGQENIENAESVRLLWRFLFFNILPRLKFWYGRLPDDDRDNY